MDSHTVHIQTIIEEWKAKGKDAALALLMTHQPSPRSSDKVLQVSLTRLINRYKLLNKAKSRTKGAQEYAVFMSSPFQYPQPSQVQSVWTRTPDEKDGEKKSELHPHLKCGHESAAAAIAEELQRTKSEKEELERLVVTEGQNKLRKKVQIKEAALYRKTKQLKRASKREAYMRAKVAKYEEEKSQEHKDDLQQQLEIMQENLKKANEKIKELAQTNEWLELLIRDSRSESTCVVTFDTDSKQYNDHCKLCIYELLNQGIPAGRICSAIKCVLKMAGKEANKLPSRSTIVDINLERLVLAQKQVAEVFSQQQQTTLLTDETSKFGRKFMGYEASDALGQLWVLGLRDIETKSAEDTLKVYQEILHDLDDRANSASNEVSKAVLCHVSATMSDRAATELKFNSLLETYRIEVLPTVISSWESLAENEKESLGNLCNFFCGLHSLVNLASTCQTALTEVETGFFQGETPIFDKSFSSKEPGTIRFVRTACKAFAMGADDKSGCFGQFNLCVKDFLTQKKMRSLPLVPFRGSRFNILFQNAGAVYFLHNKMKSFLEAYTPMNRLLSAVLHDLRVPQYVGAAKALGLISKLVTCPLWTLLEDKSVHVLDMNTYYKQLVSFLQDAVNELPRFIAGDMKVFGDKTWIQKDAVYDALVEPSTPDEEAIVRTVLSILLPAMAATCQHLFKDHLPGGRYGEMSPDELGATRLRTLSVPKTSKFAESVFGTLDHLMRAKPNISTIACEAYIMFSNNKTMQWLQNKGDEEQKRLVRESKKEVATVRKQFKIRQKEIEEAQRKAVAEKMKKKEEAARQKLQNQERCTNNIIHHGLWQSSTEVDNMVESYSSMTAKRDALKAQIRFRKDVLHQQSDKCLFSLSKKEDTKRRQLNVEELTQNIKELVQQAYVQDPVTEQTKHILVGKRVRHTLVANAIRTAYNGKIISQVPGFTQWFNITYDGDEAVYTYHRLDNDLESGDLMILVD